jgi:photosystem II stability/assembly factor-like uncharacterized protein
MKIQVSRSQFQSILLTLVLILFLVTLGMDSGKIDLNLSILHRGDSNPTTETAVESIYYFPFLPVDTFEDKLKLTDASTRDSLGADRQRFYLGETIEYHSAGTNQLEVLLPAHLTWDLDGPCGATQIFSDTVPLDPGTWEHSFPDLTPECIGDYLGTVSLDYHGVTDTLTTTFQVHLPSQVVTSTVHGFDRCALPTVDEMQTWWDSSPYAVWNIYLGGISFGCPNNPLTQDWVQAVAAQGWDFILTWVGLQPPCSVYPTRFSSVPAIAYTQGLAESADALSMAESLGLSAEKIIYFDIEIYPANDEACNQAVNAFLEGWTTGLHQAGDKSGVYAAPCFSNSNMDEWWAGISPRPDDVWIAHWYGNVGYVPTANVWTECLDHSYWADYQRLRQYSGETYETWGGVRMKIDSNVLYGEITSVTGTLGTASPTFGSRTPRIRDMDLVTSQQGWALQENHLLWTLDGGGSWSDITPVAFEGTILDVAFLDGQLGWLAVFQFDPVTGGEVVLYSTVDGGSTWDLQPSTFEDTASLGSFANAYLSFIDENHGFLVIKGQTSSSFSRGILYATTDGGSTWEARTAPLGETAIFIDPLHGWMTGGPSQDLIYATQDGGFTWEPQRLPGLPKTGVYLGQPIFESLETGVLPVTLQTQSGSQLVLFHTQDGGFTWTRIRTIFLEPGYQAGSPLPFSAYQGAWWSGAPTSSTLYYAGDQFRGVEHLPLTDLPPGLVQLDFADPTSGWALVQDANCSGEKRPANHPLTPADPFTCTLQTRLFRTEDGGLLWQELFFD